MGFKDSYPEEFEKIWKQDTPIRTSGRKEAGYAVFSRMKKREKKLISALEFYANELVYCKPDSFNCAKMGRMPCLDDCDEVSYIAEDALKEI